MIKIIETTINGAYIIESTEIEDSRGSFSRLFCNNLFGDLGIKSKKIEQINLSKTKELGTIRGLHYQLQPKMEIKIIRCLGGKVFDVIVDLRRNSKTFFNWYGVELSADNNRAIIIPEGCAHGFQSLQKNSELLYLHTASYSAELERGVRFNDPKISVVWPLSPINISERDLGFKFIDNQFEGLII